MAPHRTREGTMAAPAARRGSVLSTSSIDEERVQLEDELFETENNLLGELRQIENLTNENAAKLDHINELEAAIESLKEKNRFELEMIDDEGKTRQAELEHQRKVLHEQVGAGCSRGTAAPVPVTTAHAVACLASDITSRWPNLATRTAYAPR